MTKSETRSRQALPLLLRGCAALLLLILCDRALAGAPGGIIEPATTTATRPLLSRTQIQALLPARGKFTFPSPYGTEAIRITNAGDCGGGDCVNYVGYSYWRNSNNHTGSDTMLIFLGLSAARGGEGPTLFEYNKISDEITRVGPLFAPTNSFRYASGEGWYFSASMPTRMYLNDGARMLRYDVMTRQFETVFDAAAQFGGDKYVWQMHSSADDRVHSATLRATGSWEMLGCVVYREDSAEFLYYPKRGDFDECQVDKSGRWLVIKENVDGAYGEDNRIINLDTGVERVLLDQQGAAGHSDMGHGYLVAADNWDSFANANKVWPLVADPLQGTRVYHNLDWGVFAPAHVSHANALAGAEPGQQFACGSSANRAISPHANEVICFRLDSSLDVLVVAPVMTDLDSAGGGDDYAKLPKGNLDVSGQYFIWTGNAGGDRLDAFMVKVPAHLLTGGASGDTTPPQLALTAPLEGATVSGSVSVVAAATDNLGVVGVQFRVDGINLGAEDTAAPYSVTWDAALATTGPHTLTAVARDAAGNVASSSPVTVTVPGDVTGPAISAVTATVITASGATIAWTSNEPADSQVEYGISPAYGSATSVNASLVLAHAVTLSGLNPGTLYHFRVKSRDAKGNLSNSGDFTFTTTSSAVDSAPPSVSITAPRDRETVSGTINVTANALDNIGVTGVQFRLDGINLGVEDTTAPYTVSWNTAAAPAGTHRLTARARDGAGNSTLSASVRVRVVSSGDVTAPIISAVAAQGVTSTEAGIVWTTNEPGDSQVEYGPTAAYGGVTALNTGLITAHQQALTGLTPGSLYHFRVISRDAAGNRAASGDFTFSTTAAATAPVLVAHWKLDEAVGTAAGDASGNGHTATLMNGASWTAGRISGAAGFDGSDDYADIPHAGNLNGYPLSVSLWMKIPSGQLHGLVNKYLSGSFNGYQIFVSSGNLCAWYFRDAANFIWDGSGCTLAAPGYADNQWHHVVMVVDQSGGRLHVDGSEVAAQPWTGQPGATSTLQPLSLARYPGTAQPFLSGTLDDVRIYAGALDAAAISALYLAAPASTNVTWTDTVNATATDNSLRKTAGCDGCPDAGAVSRQQVSAGSGYMEFTVAETNTLRFAGLNGGDSGTTGEEIDFAFRLQAGVAEVRENGVYRAETPVASGDRLRITVAPGSIAYSRNGQVIHTGPAAPVYPLRVDASLYSLNATVRDAVIVQGQ